MAGNIRFDCLIEIIAICFLHIFCQNFNLVVFVDTLIGWFEIKLFRVSW